MEHTMRLLMQLHRGNRRQGPGSTRSTQLALTLSQLSNKHRLAIADIGCGTGMQTRVLATHLRGHITAIDLFPEFLARLESRLNDLPNKSALVETKVASMDDLPFARESLDLIWSEGAIYNMGFSRGVAYWKDFLRTGGILAVSEITWSTAKRPQEIHDFWKKEYPEIATASEKIAILEANGFEVLGYFLLPESDWMVSYYEPLLRSHRAFLKNFGKEPIAQEIVQMDEQEVALYQKYHDYYSYGFYVACKR